MNSPRPSRRTFFTQSSAWLAGGSCFLGAEAEDLASNPLTVIDTHVHFYDPTRPEGVPWPPSNSPIYRRTLPADYVAASGEPAPTGVIVVEASEWLADNQWLLNLAAKEPLILGIVGRLTPGEPDFQKHLANFSQHPVYRGIRVSSAYLTEHQDDAAMLEDLAALAAAGRSLDVNGPTSSLVTVARIAAAVPDLRIVVNHLGSPGSLAKGPTDEWREGLAAVASNPQVWCKFSGIVELARGEYGEASKQLEDYRPFLDFVWETFGSKRLLYGSNWPVCERGASLIEVRALAYEYVKYHGGDAIQEVFHRNARTAYALA